MKPMTNAQRLVAALTGKPVDRKPIASLMTGVTTGLMEKCGVTYPEAHQDADLMVRLAGASYEYFGIETMKLPFCMTVEAEALGSTVNFGDQATLPQIDERRFENYEDFEIPQDLLTRGRIPMVLEAIGKAKKKYGEDVAVVASIVGPFTLAGKLFDYQELLMDLLLEPERVAPMLKKVTDLCIQYAQAQQAAGCDVVQVGEASCSGDVISPAIYRDFVLPCHQALSAALEVPSVVHICGDCSGHLPYLAESGFSGFSFDYKTDVEQCHQYLDGKVALVGYVDPLEVFFRGTPEEVRQATADCVRHQVDVVNVGCAWPTGVPDENVKAFVQGAREAMGA